MPPVFRSDPYPAYNFEVVVIGISDDGKAVRGSFMEVSGLEVEVALIEYRNGSENTTLRKIPGLKKFSNIVLKFGITGDLTFWNWMVKSINGQVQRANGSVILLDENRQEAIRWNFARAWPCKYKASPLNAKGNEVAIETLELCHEGLSIDGQA
jgi:phage tail-like protein